MTSGTSVSIAALNGAVSSPPHGGSKKLDGQSEEAAIDAARIFTAPHRDRVRIPELDGHDGDAHDRETAGRFTVAARGAMVAKFAPEVRRNPRLVIFTFAPAGREGSASSSRSPLSRAKMSSAWAFVPGREF